MNTEANKPRPQQTEEGGGGGRDIIPDSSGQPGEEDCNQTPEPNDNGDNNTDS